MSGKKVKIAALTVFIVIFCASGFMAAREIYIAKNEEEALKELADIASSNREANKSGLPSEVYTQNSSGAETEQSDDIITENDFPGEQVAVWYDGLLGFNGELFGWIEIPGTNINYPVMHTPNDPEKYLHTAFDGSYSKSGVPFLAGECSESCGNMIIYGHNMRNGSMFHDLLNYKKESYFKNHPTVYFDTINSTGEYEIAAVFKSKVYKKDDESVFKYYTYTDLSTEERFDEYSENIKSASLYDTGVELKFGDTLLTLSTCNSGNDSERFVVVARLKK